MQGRYKSRSCVLETLSAAGAYLIPVAKRRVRSKRDDANEIDCDADGHDGHQAENGARDEVPATHFAYGEPRTLNMLHGISNEQRRPSLR